jgi:hypothetical protein
MRRMMGWLTIVIVLVSCLTSCDSFWPAAETPTSTLASTPTGTPTLTPTSTPTATPTIEATLTETVEATAETPETTDEPAKAFVVAQHEGEGLVAMAALTLVQLTPGRQYLVEVNSNAGAVAFTGSFSNGAVDSNGMPLLDTQLLSNTTPARWAIQPLAAALTSWTYSISVQTMGGHIRIVIWDVTDSA